MSIQQQISDEIHQNGECFTEYKNLKQQYREKLAEQVLTIQKMFGKAPANNKAFVNCFETKVKPHAFHLHSNGDMYGWFSKLNYVGVNENNEPYIKCYIVGRRKYISVCVHKMKFIDDVAKLSDYFKIIYNI